jgi:hypothetical protein
MNFFWLTLSLGSFGQTGTSAYSQDLQFSAQFSRKQNNIEYVTKLHGSIKCLWSFSVFLAIF